MLLSGRFEGGSDIGYRKYSPDLLLFTGGNTGSSLDWDFGYDFDVGTYAFVVRTLDSSTEAQSPLYTLLDPHTVSLSPG